MEFMIAFGVFFAVTLTVYGVFAKPVPRGAMSERLGGVTAAAREELALGPDRGSEPPPSGFFGRVLKSVFKSTGNSMSKVMPATFVEKLDLMLDQAGSKMKSGQMLIVFAVSGGLLPVLGVAWLASSGQTGPSLLLPFVIAVGLGLLLPRMWLLNRIGRRQKEIWRALPDAFDLVTASVEAGLGIDASFARVLERTHGPFAEELSRALREIQVGRPRREAFVDMAERTGVEELRSLIHAVVQAETMGISIAGVVRQQTHVIRTRRKQKAEEQAFKAPIKMVFPLVFLIFPAIGIVIGGPAVIQLMNVFGD
ncbi:MAG TPA: type II secretion system F family protein [Dehalococcoidia bacterium]|nr:type II secretion system F family protein [Dehalococcoidia bacterium]